MVDTYPQLKFPLPAIMPPDHDPAIASCRCVVQNANPGWDLDREPYWLTLRDIVRIMCIRMTTGRGSDLGVGLMPIGVREALLVARDYSPYPEFWVEGTYDRAFLNRFFSRFSPDIDPGSGAYGELAPLLVPAAQFRVISDNPCLAYHYLLYLYRTTLAAFIARTPETDLPRDARDLAEALVRECRSSITVSYGWLVKHSGSPEWNSKDDKKQCRFLRLECAMRSASKAILWLRADNTVDEAHLQPFLKWTKKILEHPEVAVSQLDYYDSLLAHLGKESVSATRTTNLPTLIKATQGAPFYPRTFIGRKPTNVKPPPEEQAEEEKQRLKKLIAIAAKRVHNPHKMKLLFASLGMYGFVRRKKGDDEYQHLDIFTIEDLEDRDEFLEDLKNGIELEEEFIGAASSDHVPYHAAGYGHAATRRNFASHLLRDSLPVDAMVRLLRVLPIVARAQHELVLATALLPENVRCMSFLPLHEPVPSHGLYVSYHETHNMLIFRYRFPVAFDLTHHTGYLRVTPEYRGVLPVSGQVLAFMAMRGTAQHWTDLIFGTDDEVHWRDYLTQVGYANVLRGPIPSKIRNCAARTMTALGVRDEVRAHASAGQSISHRNSLCYTWLSLREISSDLLLAAIPRLAATSQTPDEDVRKLEHYLKEHLATDFPDDEGVGSYLALPPETVTSAFARVYRAACLRIADLGRGRVLVDVEAVRADYRRLCVAYRAAAELAVGARDHADASDLHLFTLDGMPAVWVADKETRRGLEQRIGCGFVWLEKFGDLVEDFRKVAADSLDENCDDLTLSVYNRELCLLMEVPMPTNRRVNIMRNTFRTALRKFPSKVARNATGHHLAGETQTYVHAAVPVMHYLLLVSDLLNRVFPFPSEWRAL